LAASERATKTLSAIASHAVVGCAHFGTALLGDAQHVALDVGRVDLHVAVDDDRSLGRRVAAAAPRANVAPKQRGGNE
jgi:hypothetical protein